MSPRTRYILITLLSGFLFCLDQTLKYIVRTHADWSWHTLRGYVGWEYFPNPGVAFSLPIPNGIILFITPILFVFLVRYLLTVRTNAPWVLVALFFITFGALSNYVDRMLFGVTIDYLRILTGVLNLADIMIALGICALLFSPPRSRPL